MNAPGLEKIPSPPPIKAVALYIASETWKNSKLAPSIGPES